MLFIINTSIIITRYFVYIILKSIIIYTKIQYIISKLYFSFGQARLLNG